MKTSHKLVLALFAAMLGLFLANRLYEPDTRSDAENAQPLLENLASRAEHLDAVHIRQHNSQTHLEKGERGWTVVEKSHYPADSDKLRQLLQQLAEARKVEKKTARAEWLPRLNLAEPGADQGAGTLLALRFGDETIQWIVGKQAKGGGRMMRLAGENQAWRVKPAIRPMADPMQWVDSTVVNLKPELWQSIRVEPAEGLGWTLARAKPDDHNFTLDPMPAGKTFKGENISRTLATALQMLHFTDVRKAKKDADASNSLYYHGWFGDRLKVDIFDAEDGAWFAFHFEAGPEPDGNTPAEEQGAGKDTDQPTPKNHDLKTLDIQAMNERLAGWWYKLPDYKASQLNRKKDDLLKNKDEESKEKSKEDG